MLLILSAMFLFASFNFFSLLLCVFPVASHSIMLFFAQFSNDEDKRAKKVVSNKLRINFSEFEIVLKTNNAKWQHCQRTQENITDCLGKFDSHWRQSMCGVLLLHILQYISPVASAQRFVGAAHDNAKSVSHTENTNEN